MAHFRVGDASQLAARNARLLAGIQQFGRVPRCVRGDSVEKVEERLLARRLTRAREKDCLTLLQEQELMQLDEGQGLTDMQNVRLRSLNRFHGASKPVAFG